MKGPKNKLGELASTAICGNDITSSVLYVSALSIFFAGKYAWITLLMVAFVLFLFRKIYAEVVGAVPLNGGAYNALLNTTSKSMASFAATLTILSYMSTAVISANEAMHYLHHLIPPLPVIGATIGLLVLFALLTIGGIRESAMVAIVIFIFHLSSLVLLSFFIGSYLWEAGFDVFIENQQGEIEGGSIAKAIVFGFAVSMLGVSGFESSANFVEEQKKGVFPKTLRNMWIIVSIVNPLMAVFALSLFSTAVLQGDDYQNTLLVEMGLQVGGDWLAILIAIDAVTVLSGAVLTSFVGVSGLLERMTLDRVLPIFLLKKNKRGSSYRIILMFLILSISVLLFTEGKVQVLAGVYTISFLLVMGLFAIGNILLKVKRAQLPRPVRAPWTSVIFAIIAVVVALLANLAISPSEGAPGNFMVFLSYFIPFFLFVMIMLNRIMLLKVLLGVLKHIFQKIQAFFSQLQRRIIHSINEINRQEFVFFTKGEGIDRLNKVMLYIKKNEHTRKIKIVHILEDEEEFNDLTSDIDVLNREYPSIEVEYLTIKGEFGPEIISELSQKWSIPVNFMFISSPGDHFPYRVEELGGVRLIL